MEQINEEIQSLPGEEWKEIPGFPFQYISNLGRVTNYTGGLRSTFLMGRKNHKYVHVHLYNGKESKNKSVHRLIAEAFVPNTQNKPYVNHINGIKTDNRPENLEWCTQLENVRHSISIGTYALGEKHSHAKLTNDQVREIREIRISNPDITIKELSKKYGINPGGMSRVCSGVHYKNVV